MLRSPPLFPKESIVCCMVIREACDTAVYMHASVLACSLQCSVSMTLQLAVQADSGHDYHIPFPRPDRQCLLPRLLALMQRLLALMQRLF